MFKTLKEFEETKVKLLNNILEGKVVLSSLDFALSPLDYIDVMQQLIKSGYVHGIELVVMPKSDDWTGFISYPHTYTEDDMVLTLDNPRLSYEGLKFLDSYITN